MPFDPQHIQIYVELSRNRDEETPRQAIRHHLGWRLVQNQRRIHRNLTQAAEFPIENELIRVYTNASTIMWLVSRLLLLGLVPLLLLQSLDVGAARHPYVWREHEALFALPGFLRVSIGPFSQSLATAQLLGR